MLRPYTPSLARQRSLADCPDSRVSVADVEARHLRLADLSHDFQDELERVARRPDLGPAVASTAVSAVKLMLDYKAGNKQDTAWAY